MGNPSLKLSEVLRLFYNKLGIIAYVCFNHVKVIYHTIRNCSQRKEFAPSGSKLFPLRAVPILKRDAVEENHCLVQ